MNNDVNLTTFCPTGYVRAPDGDLVFLEGRVYMIHIVTKRRKWWKFWQPPLYYRLELNFENQNGWSWRYDSYPPASAARDKLIYDIFSKNKPEEKPQPNTEDFTCYQ